MSYYLSRGRIDLEIDILYRVVRNVLKAEKKGHFEVITIALLINKLGYRQTIELMFKTVDSC